MKGYTHRSPAEDAILAEHYPKGRALACRKHGLMRTQQAMKTRADKLGIRYPRLCKSKAGKVEVVEPLWPLPRHDLLESLACVQLRKWGGPVDRSPLRWAA